MKHTNKTYTIVLSALFTITTLTSCAQMFQSKLPMGSDSNTTLDDLFESKAEITQLETPIGVNGWVEIEVNGEKKKIRIHDIHIEEDTCKSIHYKHHSFLDFNRAGVPLVEIVTEADINSS